MSKEFGQFDNQGHPEEVAPESGLGVNPQDRTQLHDFYQRLIDPFGETYASQGLPLKDGQAWHLDPDSDPYDGTLIQEIFYENMQSQDFRYLNLLIDHLEKKKYEDIRRYYK